MKRVGRGMDRTDAIEEIASEWLIRRDSEHWTAADQAELEAWLAASTEHRVAFLRLELVWEEAARLKALGAGIPGDMPPPPGHWNFDRVASAPRATGRRERKKHRWPLAAAAALIMGLTAFLANWHPGQRFTTPVGGLAKVPMDDGSRITLNTNSHLAVSVSKSRRRVELEHGEAFFEVAPDPSRPFVVVAGGRRVTAVGTQFSVRRDGDLVEVIVTEGKVRMDDGTRRSSRGEPVLLTAGYIAHSTRSGLRVEQKSLQDAESRLSWRFGVLKFRDLPLGEAVAEFNRYNARKIVIADPAVAALRIEGNFRPTQVQAFVRLLESGFPVRVVTEGDRIVLASK